MSASGIWACGTSPTRRWWGFTEVPVICQTHWWVSDRISLWTFYNKGGLCGGLSGETLELRMGRKMSICLSLYLEPSPWQDTTTVPQTRANGRNTDMADTFSAQKMGLTLWQGNFRRQIQNMYFNHAKWRRCPYRVRMWEAMPLFPCNGPHIFQGFI